MALAVQITILIMAIISGLMSFGMEDTNRSVICAILATFLFTILMVWVGGFWR